MNIFAFGLNTSVIPKELILKIVSSYEENLEAFSSFFNRFRIKNPGAEAVILSTCQRFEALIFLPGPPENFLKNDGITKELERYFSRLLKKCGGGSRTSFFQLFGSPAVEHVFSVMAGFESEDIGEIQVLGQIKDSFKRCSDMSLSGPRLNKLMGRALSFVMKLRDKIPAFSDPAHIKNETVKKLHALIPEGSAPALTAAILGKNRLCRLISEKLRASGFEPYKITEMSHDEIPDAGILINYDVIISNVSDVLFTVPASLFAASKKKHYIFDISICRNFEIGVRELENVDFISIDDVIASAGTPGEKTAARKNDGNFLKIARNIVLEASTAAFEEMRATANNPKAMGMIKKITEIITAEFERSEKIFSKKHEFDNAKLKKLRDSIIKKSSSLLVEELIIKQSDELKF